MSRLLGTLRRWRQQWKYALVASLLGPLARISGRGQQGLFLPELVATLPQGPILVFAPHADDEVLGPGGTLARCAQAGRSVQVVLVTDGARGAADPARQGERLADQRRQEAQRAGEALGLPPYRFLGFPDGGLDSGQPLVSAFQELLREFRPTTVFSTFPIDYHPDHVLTARAVSRALAGLDLNPAIWCYECAAPLFPNALVDISDAVDLKERAMGEYASQMEDNDYIHTTVQGLNRFRSYALLRGKGHAEAFFITDKAHLAELIETLPRGI